MFPIKKQGLCQHLFILLLLTACQPAATNLPAETAVAHPTAISHTATATTTMTAVATAVSPSAATTTPTATATATATKTATATATKTATATATKTAFQQDASFPGPIQQLWLAPDGRPWAITDAALYVYRDGEWIAEQQGSVTILGEDDEDRVWVLLDDALAVYTAAAGWQRYGPAWDTLALNNPEDNVSGLAVDHQGRVWVAHGRNGLHRFDPAAQLWQTLYAADLGYGPPPDEEMDFASYDPHLAFTDVVLDSFGNIWVSACPLLVWEDGPITQQIRDGDGVRWFDGAGWNGPDATTARCVWDMAVDQQGRVWFAGPKNDLWSGSDDFMRYAPDSGWEWLPVPENEELLGERPSFVSRIWLDDGGAPWLFVERRGGASFPAPGLYFEQNGRWQTVADELGGSITFGANAEAWVWAWDILVVGDDVLTGLHRFQNGVWTAVPTPPDLFNRDTLLLVDGDGRLWLTGPDGTSIWYYN